MFSMAHQHWCSSRDPRSSSCDPSCTCSPCTAAHCRASGRYSGNEHSHLVETLKLKLKHFVSVNNSLYCYGIADILNIRIWHYNTESFVISLLNIPISSSSRIAMFDFWTKPTLSLSPSLLWKMKWLLVTLSFLRHFPLCWMLPLLAARLTVPGTPDSNHSPVQLWGSRHLSGGKYTCSVISVISVIGVLIFHNQH